MGEDLILKEGKVVIIVVRQVIFLGIVIGEKGGKGMTEEMRKSALSAKRQDILQENALLK
jgi:hypothetical protein